VKNQFKTSLRSTISIYLPHRSDLKIVRGDLRARREGKCNRRVPFGSGGYDHWRCQLPRHRGPQHRYRNYTWIRSGATRVEYSPLPVTPHLGDTEGPLVNWSDRVSFGSSYFQRIARFRTHQRHLKSKGLI
jgi:hypothetical protein